MAAIGIFSSSFCKADPVARAVRDRTGYKIVRDRDIVSDAGAISGMAPEKMMRAFAARTSVFNKFTLEKECSVACLKLAVAKRMAEGNLILAGFTSQLAPRPISHLLRVALIGDLAFRLAEAAATRSLSAGEARQLMRSDDEDCAAWIEFLSRTGPECWDPGRYDLFIPMHTVSMARACALIETNLLKPVVRTTAASKQALDDFRLAAEVEVALVREGHRVDVEATRSEITLRLHKPVLMQDRLEAELTSVAGRINGVASVIIEAGRGGHPTPVYRKPDAAVPSRVLLVDDERELVQTLSDRLQMRDMGSAVAYDGESAMQLVHSDDPEVMIIDLKMPGIDGLEVLRQVKETRPEIEVIILTGKGSEADKARCQQLGAFGFLEKPVDIDELSQMLKQAHQKIQCHRQ
jgi:two-component system, OmpR family, response regulator CpxR